MKAFKKQVLVSHRDLLTSVFVAGVACITKTFPEVDVNCLIIFSLINKNMSRCTKTLDSVLFGQ